MLGNAQIQLIGEEEAVAVIASVPPKLLYCNMIDPGELEPEFLNKIQHWKSGSGIFRMNVPLSELPLEVGHIV